MNKNLPAYAKPQRIFYISDRGCGRCNKQFLKLSEEMHRTKNEKDYFLIGASKLLLDISYFIENGDRVRILKQHKNMENFLDSSAVIYLKENQFDTLIILRATGLDKQLEFIKNK